MKQLFGNGQASAVSGGLFTMRNKTAIEVSSPVPIVIPTVGNTVPLRFITDCSGQFGEIERTVQGGVIFRVAVLGVD